MVFSHKTIYSAGYTSEFHQSCQREQTSESCEKERERDIERVETEKTDHQIITLGF